MFSPEVCCVAISDQSSISQGDTDAATAGHNRTIQFCSRRSGNSETALFSIAIAYSGGASIELVQQHDDTPSVYNERSAGAGVFFHHMATMTESFDSDLERYTRLGCEPVFEGAVAVGGQFAYVDTQDRLGGLIELIELTPVVKELFAAIEVAAVNWDGKNPIRYL